MFKKYLTIIFFVSMMFFSGVVSAQDDCVPTPTSPCEPPSLPINGGLGLLLVLGVGYAVKKLREKK